MKRGNVPTQSCIGKSAVFRMQSSLTSHDSSKSVKKRRRTAEESRTITHCVTNNITISGLWFLRSQLISISLLLLLSIFFCWGGYSLILININKTFVADYFGFLIDIEYSACPFKKHSIFFYLNRKNGPVASEKKPYRILC